MLLDITMICKNEEHTHTQRERKNNNFLLIPTAKQTDHTVSKVVLDMVDLWKSVVHLKALERVWKEFPFFFLLGIFPPLIGVLKVKDCFWPLFRGAKIL